ncbi:uncharacterized protein LOC119234597 isoform X2 [Talpa occidentalis]|uniref:uncharacterized protein LOC119234597 isoform X2 n=1 Tax=Talpa occidentalis TaxID=50954 RepID=UPI00188EAB84|nr:uncharacterized protein LOC119234597 isoform X2 [Talpa occidentalis]
MGVRVASAGVWRWGARAPWSATQVLSRRRWTGLGSRSGTTSCCQRCRAWSKSCPAPSSNACLTPRSATWPWHSSTAPCSRSCKDYWRSSTSPRRACTTSVSVCRTITEAVEHRIHDEQRAMDQKIVLELDRKVADQQSTLEKAGVTGFYVTTNPQELTLQMNLLELIRKLQQRGCQAGKATL